MATAIAAVIPTCSIPVIVVCVLWIDGDSFKQERALGGRLTLEDTCSCQVRGISDSEGIKMRARWNIDAL